MNSKKIALVYDRVNTPYGGAENVLLALHQIFPDAPLYTSVYDPKRASWAKVFAVHTSFLQKIPWAKKLHRIFVPLMPLAFESLDLSAFDIVISVTSAEAKGVLTKPHQLHLCYLLTPTRYLWSHALEYQQHWLTGWFRKYVFDYLRWWDQAAALRPDVLIPISQLVAKRCAEYYLREAEKVIYPTVGSVPKVASTPQISQLAPEIRPYANRYNLIVARLVPYKKIDLAIEASQKAQKHVVIIGQGPDLQRLKSMVKKRNATAKVFFLQAVHPEQLLAYYHYCTAFLAPAEEDFGITVIEAQQAGKPVVVFAQSGGAEVIQEGKSGVHFFAQTVDDLSEAIHIAESLKWDNELIRKDAAQFTSQSFQQEFAEAVEYHWREKRKEVYGKS